MPFHLRDIPCITLACLLPSLHGAGAAQRDISPPGSVAFGTQVAVLPNGNIVATDPAGPTQNIGSVFLLAPDGSTISSFTGSSPNDQVGSGGVMVLANGNFVVVSPHWSNNGASNAGAVTWVDGAVGLNGVVSADNSLVGTSANDAVGFATDPSIPPQDTVADYSIQPLPNGNYYVLSPNWNNGAATQAGAVTFGSGSGATSGAVSATNSLVGAHAGDRIGSGSIWPLGNGAAVVLSPSFSSAIAGSIGAATWLSATQAPHGAVSAGNSLVGISPGDQVGLGGVLALSNGNYVVFSPSWSNGAVSAAGAATWARGDAATTGIVSPANSLVGSSANDQVGDGYGVELSNGHYVVQSSGWNSVGAITWGDGTHGVAGAVAASNSLVGSSPGDFVSASVTPLANGNYVADLPYWSNGSAPVGAALWAAGNGVTVGAVSSSNALVGSVGGDLAYSGVSPLPNGAYVVTSPYWSNAAAGGAGAATYARADGSTVGTLSAANSLVGSSANDHVGSGGAIVLGSGDFVVPSPAWSNGAVAQAGAITWGSASAGVVGAVSPANSLVGSNTADGIGSAVIALSNGRFAAAAPNWSSPSVAHVGIVAAYRGNAASVGTVTAADGITGSSANDFVGSSLRPLRNGDYLIVSSNWSNAASGAMQTGAVTWFTPAMTPSGAVSPDNSFVGTFANDRIGSGSVTINGRHLSFNRPWTDGNFQLGSLSWNGAAGGGGALTLLSGQYRFTGNVQDWNSVLLPIAGEAAQVVRDYDPSRKQMVLGLPQENRVTLVTYDRIFADGLE